MSLLIRR